MLTLIPGGKTAKTGMVFLDRATGHVARALDIALQDGSIEPDALEATCQRLRATLERLETVQAQQAPRLRLIA